MRRIGVGAKPTAGEDKKSKALKAKNAELEKEVKVLQGDNVELRKKIEELEKLIQKA